MSSGASAGLPVVTQPCQGDDTPPPTDPPGPRFRRRVVTIVPGETLPFVEADWADTLVVIERGDVDLCCSRGGRRRFGASAILVLTGLSLVSLHNPGVEDAVLVSLSRAHPPRP